VLDVLVVGAGVIGASVAWHLAVRGCRNVAGDRSRAAAGRRQHISATRRLPSAVRKRRQRATLAPLAGQAAAIPRRGRRRSGISADRLSVHRPTGRTSLAFRAAQAIQHAAGLTEARMVDEGAFCPTDGFIAPMQILTGYIDAAK
jgi:glycine/D-amino acid oxidase-like deaminating enzyme